MLIIRSVVTRTRGTHCLLSSTGTAGFCAGGGPITGQVRSGPSPPRSRQALPVPRSVRGAAEILSIVIDREMGSIERFSCPKHFCGYAGTVPKVKGSGGKFHYGRMIKQCNNYLKWAFIACPGGLGQGGGECGGSAPPAPQLAKLLAGAAPQTPTAQQGACRRCRCD